MDYLNQKITKLKSRLEHKQEFANIEERLRKLETVGFEDKVIADRNRQLIEVIRSVQNDIRELQIEINAIHKEVGLSNIAVENTINSVKTSFDKIDVLNNQVLQNKLSLESLSVRISEVQSMIENPKNREVAISHDSEIEKLKKEFENFKKHALVLEEQKREIHK